MDSSGGLEGGSFGKIKENYPSRERSRRRRVGVSDKGLTKGRPSPRREGSLDLNQEGDRLEGR